MWKISDLLGLGLIFIASSVGFCFGELNNTSHDDNALKISLVDEIVRKVCNISLATFSNKAPAEKNKMLIKIEEKLNKSAHTLGPHGEKYVQLIMRGVKSKAFGNNISEFKIENNKSEKTNILRENKGSDQPVEPKNDANITKSKNKLVSDIAEKIEFLAKVYLKEAKTKEERQRAIQNIKRKIIESADRKHAMLHSKHQEIKTYVDLVGKGIELIMAKNTEATNNKRRRMEFVFTDNINVNKDRKHTLDQLEPIKGNSFHNNELDHGITYSYVTPKPKSVTFKTNKLNDLKIESLCDEALEETCHKVKLVNTFQCQTSETKINILKLCDGVGDCLDFSDERRCTDLAIETIQSAHRLMKHIDTYLSQNCYSDLRDRSVVSKQSQILNEVLQNQLSFLHKHALQDASKYSRRVINTDAQSIKKTINEAVAVVNSLSSALQTSLCSRLAEKARKNNDDRGWYTDFSETATAGMTLELCKCNGQNCMSNSCSRRCSQICYKKYSLSQWLCQAVTGESFVSLDMICDGKLDCYDERDERGCSRDIGLVKFEANKMYEYVLDMIKTKSLSEALEPVRNRLLNLHALVIKLQKLSMKRHADAIEVKRIRDGCFAELTAIYDSTARYVSTSEELVDMYVFLLTINERLISALKRSHTGNDKIISPDGCICRGYECVLPRCSDTCTRACSAEPKLTRYFCNDATETNNSIPIDLICNGKNNCPNGDDENDCKKEVCRGHHLVLLRHNLRDVGLVHQGTAMGEALRSWGVKVSATLKVAENSDRPTPVMLRDILHDILHDLVMAYATVEDNRRSDTGTIFQEFYTWSRVVIDTLKSCGQ